MRTVVLAVMALGVFVVAAIWSFEVEAQFVWQSLGYLLLGLLALMCSAVALLLLLQGAKALIRCLRP